MKGQIFVSHRKVKAIPMTRQEYYDHRGWTLPEGVDGSEIGYIIEHLDGGQPNHPDHKGYISWSPKDSFDNGYSLAKST